MTFQRARTVAEDAADEALCTAGARAAQKMGEAPLKRALGEARYARLRALTAHADEPLAPRMPRDAWQELLAP